MLAMDREGLGHGEERLDTNFQPPRSLAGWQSDLSAMKHAGIEWFAIRSTAAGADEPRESMNLRFGLHTPAFANKEVYWQFAPRKEPRKPKREPKPRAAPTRASARLAKPSAADTQP